MKFEEVSPSEVARDFCRAQELDKSRLDVPMSNEHVCCDIDGWQEEAFGVYLGNWK